MSLSLTGTGLRDSWLISLLDPGGEVEFLTVVGERRSGRPEEPGELQRPAAQLERHRPPVGEPLKLREGNRPADGDIDLHAEAVGGLAEQQRDAQRIAE